VTTYKQITTAYNNLQTNKQRMSHYAEDGTLKFETPQQEILFLKQQLASSHMIRDEQEKTIEKYRKVQEENERLYDEKYKLEEEIELLKKTIAEQKTTLQKIFNGIEPGSNEEIRINQILYPENFVRTDEEEEEEEEIEELETEIEQLKKENAELTDKVMYLEKELDEVQDDFNEEEEKVETLETEIEQLKQQLNEQRDYVDTMEYETKIEQLEGFNGGQEFWNDAEDVLEVLQNDGLDEEEIKRIIEDKCSGYTFDIDKEELVKVE
jgi:DNA repair exonuclease SbcCD ATPase subunit